MKNSLVSFKALALIIAFVIFNNLCHAQTVMVKAQNKNCYFNTDAGSLFTWSGDCRDGYCDGYGTIQWYDANGNSEGKFIGNLSYGKAQGYATQYYANGYISYQGYWSNDMRNGQGTSYYNNGAIEFQGNFIDDAYENYSAFNTFGAYIGNAIMQNIFDGGENLRSSLIQVIDQNGQRTMRIRITFNGNIVETNYYGFTLVISNQAPYVSFENVSPMAVIYLTLEAADEINRMTQSDKNN
jgi:hypothetical protein